VTESPDIGKRYGSALASVFGTLPRRLLIITGFAVLGWIGLALLGTSSASAAPDHGAANDAAGASVPLLGSSLSEVTQPVVAAAAPVADVAAPVAQVARPVTATAARLTDDVAPATRSLTKALAPVTSALPKPSTSSLTNNSSGLLPTLARSADELSGAEPLTSSELLPMLSGLLGVGAAPAPGPAPVAPAPVAPVQATSGGHGTVQIEQTTSSTTSRPADESRPATTGPASAMHGPLAVLGVPVPLPAAPPAGPDTLLVGGAGLTLTTNSGPGGSSAAGCSDELASPADLRPVGTADSARTRPVRNSATEPPVSPD
jgi:hypothetical protein